MEASPQTMARLFRPKVVECTTHLSSDEKVLWWISRVVTNAAHGTYPPLSAFATVTMSGSRFQCWNANHLPVRPSPVLDFVHYK